MLTMRTVKAVVETRAPHARRPMMRVRRRCVKWSDRVRGGSLVSDIRRREFIMQRRSFGCRPVCRCHCVSKLTFSARR